jgi:hypothetical protein
VWHALSLTTTVKGDVTARESVDIIYVAEQTCCKAAAMAAAAEGVCFNSNRKKTFFFSIAEKCCADIASVFTMVRASESWEQCSPARSWSEGAAMLLKAGADACVCHMLRPGSYS